MRELRRLIVDTDTGSDDCWAIIEALRATDVVRVEAVTVVCGNFPLDLCVKNAMLAIEAAGTYLPPVYRGMERPLLSAKIFQADYVHGSEAGRFCALCTRTLQRYYHRLYGKDSFGVVDSMLLTAALYPEVMEDVYEANCAVELQGTETRGYLRIDRYGRLKKEPNAAICPRINAAAYKERLFALLCGK